MTRAIDGTSVSRSNKTPWEGLSMAEKAALMKEAVDNGVYDLKAVRSGYDSFVKVAEPVVEEVSISEPSVTDGVPLDKLRRSLEDFYVNIEPNVFAGGGNKSKQRVNPLKQQFLNTMEQALKESSSHNSAQWRKFLTDLADMESSYNANITNNIGAKGYFQLMPFNRAKSWSSPTQQFHEMFKLTDGNLDYFKKNLTKEDWANADRMGIDIYGLLAGAHLGGVKGALNALRGRRNAKDSNGTSVMHYMKKFSQHPSRDSIFSNLERQVTNLKSQAADFVMRHSNSDVSELQENIFNTDNTDGSWHVPMMLPSNPTVFSNLTQFTQPSWIPQRPDISEVFKAYDESKKQEELAEKQAERQQHMNNMRFFMNLMDYGKPKGDGSSFMSTIGMLAGNGMNNNPYSLDSKGNGGNSKGSELTLMPMFGNMYAGGDKIERRKGIKGGEPVEYYDASEVMPIVADNMGKSIVLDEVEVTPSRRLPIQDALFEGITNQAANERADEYTNKTSLTPGRFLGLMGANVPLAAGALGATVAAPALFDSTIAPLSDYVAGTKAGQAITGLLSNPYFNTAVEAGFAGHGLNHIVNDGVDGWGDAAMTALEVTPLGRLAKPVYERVVQPGMKLFNSPLTGNWTKIGNREYRLSSNSLGINGSLLESRAITPQITAENAASMTPEQWIAAQDAAYKNAVMSGNRKKALELLDEAYKRSGVPETIITMDASGHPKIWYTGSEYGNHTIFDSSKFNATIGGESAVGKIKGNFLTTDLPSAARYAGSGVGEVHEFTEPSTFLERFQNIFGKYRPERIHPTDRIPEILRPKPDRLFTIKDADVIDYLDETDKVVYPMYVNPGERVYTVDFKGNPWSRSPIKFPNSFSIKKTIRDDIAKTYRDEIVPFKDRETAIEYYKSLVDRFGKQYVEDPAKLAEKKFPHPGGDRSIEMFASAPTYEKASLIETHTPATTNGAVQTAEREGYTSVYMPNVIDSNVRGGVPYAIDDFVTLDSRQMKIADITYDDAGELIPLSKRFNWNNPDSRYDMPNSTVIESRVSAKPNIPYDEAYNAAAEGRHDMKNLVGSKEYADRVRLAYRDNNLPVNQADFEIMEAAQNIKDSKLKVVPNLKNAKGEALNGQYNLDTGEALIAQDRDNILDIARTSGHEHAHASEVEKLLNMLKKKWAHIKPRKEAYTNSDGSLDTEWKDYISKITEMRAPAMSVWSGMKKLGFNKVGDYLAHLSRLGMKDKQWEALVDRYGIKNAKYMVETVFGISPLMLINKSNDEKEISTAM